MPHLTYPIDKTNRVKRRHDRGFYDHETVHKLLDAASLAHVAYVFDGLPYCTPTLFWRQGTTLYWHGSSASRMLRTQSMAQPVCLTVTHLDSLVLARSGFNHSADYRSVMAFGHARLLDDPAAKAAALIAMVDRLFPKRTALLRATLNQEIKATAVVAMQIEKASAKIRARGVVDEDEDYDLPIYAERLPIRTVIGAPEPCPRLISGITRPHQLDMYREGRPLEDALPTLIIDDEADQASLNTLARQQRQSTTYQRLLEVRDAVPNHTFLQYTATPQAPLLINIIDALSPSFVEVLEPGTGYVGGSAFFIGNMPLVRVIDPLDISTDDNPLVDPPEPLREALRVFLLGVAAGLVEGQSARNPRRSMLVHPSQRTDSHAEYWRWISSMFDDWQRVLELPDADSDKQDLIEEFRKDHADLAQGGVGLPSFDDLARRLPRAFRKTKIEQVNARAGQTPEIDWSQSYGWILVGGQAMDRGFTIEGLTVTYMPRGPGLGNADTVQQRGRFFGYKQRYLGFCRIYLEQEALNAFEDYVAHEEDMRRQLADVQRSGKPLSEWKRRFVLSPDLKACRRNVIEYDYVRGNYSDRWFYPSIADAPDEVLEANRATTTNFIAGLNLVVDPNLVSRDPAQRHKVRRELSLAQVVSDLIVPFRVTGAADSRNMVGAMLQLSKALDDNCAEACTVYQISPEYQRFRAIDANGKINELFQGATRLIGGGHNYPGDSVFRDDDIVTIQLHTLQLRRGDAVVAENVPVIAVWIPRRLELDWISQHQAEQDA